MRPLLLAMTLGTLAGCSVGPDFVRPTPALPSHWQAADAPHGAVDRQWWQQLGDPQLTALVERAASANLDVRSAAIRVAQSRIGRDLSSAEQLPGISARGSYQRARNSEVGLNDPSKLSGLAPYELWSTAVDASWEVDLWGHVRRSLEAADATLALSQAERDGVLLSVTAQMAGDYVRLRGVQARLQVARQNLEIAQRNQALTQARFENGVTTNLDTANAGAAVDTLQATLPMLEAEQARLINAMSLLLGAPPGTLEAQLLPPAAIPQPTADVPLGLPSELAQRRPDIQRAEAALHRATAAIGVAQADFYPRVSLGASLGYQALEGSDLGDWNSRAWSYGPSLYLPIFQGGRLTGTLALREHQQQAAAIDYQRTVLQAWHEVADTLSDYHAERRHQAALGRAVAQNQQALDTARQRYREGAIDFINVLNVQRALLDTQSALVDSATQAALDRVRLYKALGGGWPMPAATLAP